MADSTSNILEQFKQMQKSGALNELETLKKQNKDLERIITDISRLIQFTKIDEMLDFMISKFLDYFIPEYLTFLIKPPRSTSLRQYCYHQLVKTNQTLPTEYYDTLKSFFEMEQVQSTPFYLFTDIVKKLGTDKFDTDFTSRNPYILIPLTGIGGIYGIAILSDKVIGDEYNQQEMQYIERMFSVLAVTIQNGLHYETSIKDPKTGLFTYDYFITRVKESILMSKRYSHSFGLIMIDIDFFKKFNDTWGHLAGDRVLVALSEILLQTVRSTDCVARFGGEEFSVLLRECTNETLFLAAERIRKAVSEIVLYEKEDKLTITISLGACMIDGTQNISPKYIIKKADQALYHSKQTGRNKSTVFSMGLLDKINMLKDGTKNSDGEDTSDESSN